MMNHFGGIALLKRVSRSTLLRNAEKLGKSLLVTSMPGFFKCGNYYGGKDVHGEGGMKDKDGIIVVNAKDCGKLWKEHMERILNVENEWD